MIAKRNNNICVKATNIETGETRYFNNANYASQILGFTHPMASYVLNGKRDNAKGYVLEYVEIDSLPPDVVIEKKKSKERRSTMTQRTRKELSNRRSQLQSRVRAIDEELRLSMIDYQRQTKHVKSLMAEKLRIKKEARKVIQYTIDGSFVREWPSTYQAQVGTGLWNIPAALVGVIPDCGGYVWRYKIDTPRAEV